MSLFKQRLSIDETCAFKAITPRQLDMHIERYHRDYSEFINKCSGQASFNGLMIFTSSKTGEKLELAFENFEQWTGFYQDFVSFKSNELSLQSVIDNHRLRVQESRIQVLGEAESDTNATSI